MLRWLLSVALLLQFTTLFSQNWNLIYSKEIEAEDYLLENQYEKAALKYLDALKLHPTNGNLLYKVGRTYMQTPDKKLDALKYLEMASEKVSTSYDPRVIKEEAAPPNTFFLLGKVYQISNQFDKAISAFNRYKGALGQGDPIIKLVDKQIEACHYAPQLMANNIGVQTTNLGKVINDKNANSNPVISGDGKTLAFTSFGNNGYDIFVSKKKDGVWGKPKKITDDLRGNFLKTTSLSYDGTWMYLVDDVSKVANIYDTFFEDGYWVRAKKLKKPVTSKYNESHAAISPDGKTLYFTSDRPGGQGGLDIYKSSLDEKERWSEPESLGSRVNTELNENTPFVSPDGKYLFFSSEGHNNMGGYDVFYIDLSGSAPPINLGYPINNACDNLFYHPENLLKGYMALTESENIGPQDLYEVKILPLVKLIGNLASSDGGLLPSVGEATVSIYNSESVDPLAQVIANMADRSFSKNLLPGDYRVEITSDGFENFTTQLSINQNIQEQLIDIELIPTPKEPEILLAEKAESVIPEIVEQKPVEVAEQLAQNRDVPVPKEKVTESAKVEQIEKEKVEPSTPQPKPKPEPKPQPKPQPAKPLRSSIVANTPVEGQFTVQIMALLVPASENYFSNITGLSVIQGEDGYYRYFVGSTSSREEAGEIQRQLRGMGYKGAFIRKLQVAKPSDDSKPKGTYTIQIYALKNPVDTNRFSNLPDLSVVASDDLFYRYFTGNYASYEQASNDLKRIVELGYKGAFVRRL